MIIAVNRKEWERSYGECGIAMTVLVKAMVAMLLVCRSVFGVPVAIVKAMARVGDAE